MLRILRNTILFAIAILVGHLFRPATPASGQEPAPVPEAAVQCDDNGACQNGAACRGAACGRCGKGLCNTGNCGHCGKGLCNAGNCGHCGNGLCHGTQINCRQRQDGQPELFYNYYIPGTCGGVPAALYVAPRPVPPMVGWTYYTYQPAMPHELLYTHHRTYYRYYDNGRGLTRTHISWYRPPVQSALGGLYNHFRLAR